MSVFFSPKLHGVRAGGGGLDGEVGGESLGGFHGCELICCGLLVGEEVICR